MATKKPRLTITLDPDLSESLRRLSELTGNSQSSLISEMLSGSGPVLEKMITVLEAAQVAKDAIKGRITRGLDDAQGKFEQALGLAFDGFDDIFRIQQLRLHSQYLIGVVYIHLPRLYTLFPVEERSDLGKTIGTIDICFKLNGFHTIVLFSH